jgi:hypothetical protein
VPSDRHGDDDRIDIQTIQPGSKDREPDDMPDLVEQLSVTTDYRRQRTTPCRGKQDNPTKNVRTPGRMVLRVRRDVASGDRGMLRGAFSWTNWSSNDDSASAVHAIGGRA